MSGSLNPERAAQLDRDRRQLARARGRAAAELRAGGTAAVRKLADGDTDERDVKTRILDLDDVSLAQVLALDELRLAGYVGPEVGCELDDEGGGSEGDQFSWFSNAHLGVYVWDRSIEDVQLPNEFEEDIS